jgi:hypothetical protein
VAPYAPPGKPTNMKPKVLLSISLCLLWIFAVPIAISFVTPHLRDFLGDVRYAEKPLWGNLIDPNYSWGVRHYWFFWGCIFLWLLSIVNCAVICTKVIIKNYPNLTK